MSHDLPSEIPSGSRVLVTGATGFTGSVLTRKLCARNLEVRAIARPTSHTKSLDGLGVEWVRGEVFDDTTIRTAMKGVDYVFHLAAAFREARHGDEYYRKVHVQSTELLARAALRNPQFKRFVHVSTIGVHGHISNPPADENYRFAPGDVYQRTKAEAEQWLRDFAHKEQLQFSVIRPAGIYGPGDRRLLKVFRLAARGVFPLLGFGKCLYHLIHVDDLTDAIILAAYHEQARDEVFICGNAEHIFIGNMAQIIAGSWGRSVRIVRIPIWPFFLLASACVAICKPLGIEPPIHRRRVAFYTKDRSFDTEKIRRQLGLLPRTNEVGLAETAAWYRDHGWIKV